jgi:signal transduction histidine kinase
MRIVVDRSAAPTILGDAGLLRIATNNLLNNAIKYGTPGSDVRVGVALRDDWALLTVHNIGPGISAKDVEHRLFKRFERLKQKGTEGVKGSGLGLYICKQIVERHGGEISVISDAESYVEFRIALKRV